MQNSFADRVLRAFLAALIVLAFPALAAAPKKSPFVEILGQGMVVTTPRETTHRNRRKFLEFEMTLSSARPTASQPTGADVHLAIETSGRVRVVHDLTCGAAAVALTVGDRIEIQGEYVHVPKGQDLIHFTHAADGKCGRQEDAQTSKHPGGFLRKATVPPTPPRPVAIVPDQPYTGPPPPGERPYAAIAAAKEGGASNTELLARVEREQKAYSLTTPEIQKLRAAGVSEDVIEAMLRTGRTPRPAAATPAPTPR